MRATADARGRARAYRRSMSTTLREPAQDVHALTPAEREWIRRQGRAARTLETRQRRELRSRRAAARLQRPATRA